MNVVYCTIASANYLPRVKVLADSLAKHQPGAVLHILLCEWPNRCAELSVQMGVRFLSPADVCPAWQQMAFSYDVTEFNTALKPFLLAYLLERHADAVFYFDPDIEIFGTLDPLEDLALRYDLILTPHVCEPLAMDGLKPGIDEIIRLGQFNLGFIGLKRSVEVEQALRWWQEVCIDYCVADLGRGYFVDQFWAAVLPSFIQDFHCLRAPEYNAAYWNIFQRSLQRTAGGWLCQGRPLKFFHFSGLPSHDLSLVSRHQNRVNAIPGSALHTLLQEYQLNISRNSWSSYSDQPYSFACFSDGSEISMSRRRAFLALPQVHRLRIANPFDASNHVPTMGQRRGALVRLMRGIAARLGEFALVTEEQGIRKALGQTLRYVLRGMTRRPNA
jgi:hypothetical protein